MNAAEPADAANAEPPAPEAPPAAAAAGPPEPYRHDEALVPALAQLADAACQDATDMLNASLSLRAVMAQTDSPVDASALKVLYNTFCYRITPASVDAVAGATLEPVDGRSFMPFAMREASDDIRQL